jgi:hypothetical protein
MEGQVVIINASEHGVDALIFAATGPIEHVPLPVALADDITLNRPANTSQTARQKYVARFLKPALRTVWNDNLLPIFHKIDIDSDTALLPRRRIWWDPTGPVTFIPIHAAGSEKGFIDATQLAISSYITTFQSFFHTQTNNGPVRNSQRTLICISQPETPGQSSLPQTTGEVDGVVQVFRSSGCSEEDIICLRGAEATMDHVLHALDSCSWLHFACHGYQDPKLGFQSAFALHDGHLRLSDIASKSLSNGQLAFLSACHAASGLKHLPGESMHLAARLQFTGFPSVIAQCGASVTSMQR